MITNINIREKYDKITEYWTPKIIGELNGQHVKLAKVKGDFLWHSHDNEDELFIVYKGTLFIEFRDKTATIPEGQLIIVPKGVEHRPYTNGEEVWIMLLEPKEILHTGNVVDEKTVTNLEWI